MEPHVSPIAIRVMVFNIEDGGEGVDLRKVVEAIRLVDPDVVALQEAWGNTARVADALGWGFASHRTQVLSRHRLFDPPPGDPGPGFVEVRSGRVAAIASVHLPAEPYGPELALRDASASEVVALERRIRLRRIEPTLASLTPLIAGGVPVILVGDFNAPSHLDWTEATVGARPHMRRSIDWPVSRAIEAAGFHDAWRDAHPDPVADPGLTWWATRPPTGGYEPDPETPHDRIDAVHVAGPATTVDCRIVGEIGRPDVAIAVDPWPSDHRAVVADVVVTPARLPGGRAALVPSLAEALRPPDPPTRFEVSRPTYRVGEAIDVRWEGGPGYRWDWIAIFREPVLERLDAHLAWMHTGARIDGTVRLDGASAVIDQSSVGGVWPLPPGRYDVAYLLDDSPQALARASLTIED